MTPALRITNLVKKFGDFVAIDDLSLEMSGGTILGVLGPNGAGKTTTINVCTTLIAPDSGHVEVAGFDVVTAGHEVRKRISLTGQFAAVDGELTGLENLSFFGQLMGLSGRTAKARGTELLGQFGLSDAANERVKNYSGGMRRRLDLAVSMVDPPEVLFLDEPTTGLDPRSRMELWDVVRELNATGTSIFLTTQYLEEADQLADRIVVIDHGRVIAEGTVHELGELVGGVVVTATVTQPDALHDIGTALDHLGDVAIDIEAGQVHVSVAHIMATNGDLDVGALAAHFVNTGIAISDIGLRRPTLDEVFLQLTGNPTDATESEREST